MNEYAITFRRFKNSCKLVFKGPWKKKASCIQRMNMDWVKSQEYKTYADCTEANCPILEKCDKFIN